MLSATSEHDHGKKFWHYRHLESLHTYLLISSEEVICEVYERQDGNDWRLRTFDGPDAMVRLEHLELELTVATFYEKTSLIEGDRSASQQGS